MTPRCVVVGIGADGYASLADTARNELQSAEIIYGSRRQLDLLPESVTARRVGWRSPMSEHLTELIAELRDETANTPATVHVLASGDPMFHGVGSTIAAELDSTRLHVVPAPSSVSLAAARLGWDLATCRVVSLVTADIDVLVPELTDGASLLVLGRDGRSPERIAELLTAQGFGRSTVTVLSDLGGPDESTRADIAEAWTRPHRLPTLNVIAVCCRGPLRLRAAGLPDTEFDNDGQLTKAPVRALTIAALAPADGQVLWDVGAGSGSVGIEWLRLVRRGTVIAFEADEQRAGRLRANARRHGVAASLTARGSAPDAFIDAPRPDTVFIGGGHHDDLLTAAWQALLPGGRIVVNAVTVETERAVLAAHAELGGELTRIHLERAAPLGSRTTWRPALPIVQWTADKPAESGAMG